MYFVGASGRLGAVEVALIDEKGKGFMKYRCVEDDTKTIGDYTLVRIQRVSDGTLGGFIQSEANLDQEGTCWIHDDSVVYENAIVKDDAQLYGQAFGNALITGRAEVFGQVYGSARVTDRAKVYGSVGGNASVEGDRVVYGRLE